MPYQETICHLFHYTNELLRHCVVPSPHLFTTNKKICADEGKAAIYVAQSLSKRTTIHTPASVTVQIYYGGGGRVKAFLTEERHLMPTRLPKMDYSTGPRHWFTSSDLFLLHAQNPAACQITMGQKIQIDLVHKWMNSVHLLNRNLVNSKGEDNKWNKLRIIILDTYQTAWLELCLTKWS